MDYVIREIRETEHPMLSEFLYEAIFIPGDGEAAEIHTERKLRGCHVSKGRL